MAKELSASRLRRFNLIIGIFHLLQMIAVIALTTDFSLPVNATYMSGPPGTTFAEPVTIFSVLIGPAVALFLGISALAHFIIASPQFFPRYAAGLAAKRNRFHDSLWMTTGNVCASGSISDVSAPGFVYGIAISLFAFFNSFAAVALL